MEGGQSSGKMVSQSPGQTLSLLPNYTRKSQNGSCTSILQNLNVERDGVILESLFPLCGAIWSPSTVGLELQPMATRLHEVPCHLVPDTRGWTSVTTGMDCLPPSTGIKHGAILSTLVWAAQTGAQGLPPVMEPTGHGT